jgi:PleD family two-component response regulator
MDDGKIKDDVKPAEKTVPEKKNKKIVYLDDVFYNLASIKERLKNRYEIYPAQTEEKLFDILRSIHADLILLDVNMPEVSGFEMLEKLKADDRYAHIPIVFLSAKNDRKNVIKGMANGAVDFITKPVTTESLVECIEYHLNPALRAADKPVVLIIDDCPTILYAVNHLLGENYTIYTLPGVEHEKMLAELLKKISPDLFILDYNMPTLSGFNLIPIIRNIPGYKETPIIFLTAEKNVDAVTVAANLGACDFIAKPIDEAVLKKKIAKCLKDFLIRRRVRALNEDKR